LTVAVGRGHGGFDLVDFFFDVAEFAASEDAVVDVEAEVVDVAAENVEPVDELADLFGVLQVVFVGVWVLSYGRCVQLRCGAGRSDEFTYGARAVCATIALPGCSSVARS
jgi:hypothetical protein